MQHPRRPGRSAPVCVAVIDAHACDGLVAIRHRSAARGRACSCATTTPRPTRCVRSCGRSPPMIPKPRSMLASESELTDKIGALHDAGLDTRLMEHAASVTPRPSSAPASSWRTTAPLRAASHQERTFPDLVGDNRRAVSRRSRRLSPARRSMSPSTPPHPHPLPHRRGVASACPASALRCPTTARRSATGQPRYDIGHTPGAEQRGAAESPGRRARLAPARHLHRRVRCSSTSAAGVPGVNTRVGDGDGQAPGHVIPPRPLRQRPHRQARPAPRHKGDTLGRSAATLEHEGADATRNLSMPCTWARHRSARTQQPGTRR